MITFPEAFAGFGSLLRLAGVHCKRKQEWGGDEVEEILCFHLTR